MNVYRNFVSHIGQRGKGNMDLYQRWLQAEMEWIGVYCSKIRRQSLFVTAPLILAGSTVVIGALSAVGGGSMADLGYGAFGGFMMGAIVCGIFLLVLLPGLSPKRYGKKIDKCVKGLSLSEAEKEKAVGLHLRSYGQHVIASDPSEH